MKPNYRGAADNTENSLVSRYCRARSRIFGLGNYAPKCSRKWQKEVSNPAGVHVVLKLVFRTLLCIQRQMTIQVQRCINQSIDRWWVCTLILTINIAGVTEMTTVYRHRAHVRSRYPTGSVDARTIIALYITEQEIWANAHETRHSISLISYAGCLGPSPIYFSENSL